MKKFSVGFGIVAGLIGVLGSESAFATLQCQSLNTMTKEGARYYNVLVKQLQSNSQEVVAFYHPSARDVALSKCDQLVKVNSCSIVRTQTVAIHGIGEHVHHFEQIKIYGHPLQNWFSQTLQSGFAGLDECETDLADAIAEQLK